ncbi:tetratricopeptide repeat protein [Deinococcus apachensis]|uniref:tetratricopeptide repeat protein n=1 Tax=Deinococcus apachensis TaxID=309886 RepID=UPI0012FBACB8|nr:tetratricopeptide repeat protein [Deinococcus apachensis]
MKRALFFRPPHPARRRLRFGLMLFTLTTSHALGAAVGIEGSPVLRGVQDTQVFDDVSVNEDLQDAWSALGPKPVAFTPLPLPQAIANLEKLMDARGGKAARAKLEAVLKGRSALQASEIAAAAVLRQRPVAAVQALLFAHRAEPKRAAHLVNLGGLTATLGLPNEALALLAEAEKLGGHPRAVLLNNRGRALILVGRYKEAEVALREAVKLDAWLSEAKRNLALALYTQKKTQEAVRFMRGGRRRSPELAKDAAEKPVEPVTMNGPQDEGEAQAGVEHWAPSALVFDLSRAKDGHLPALPFPRDVAGLPQYARRMQALRLEYVQRAQSRAARTNALVEQMRQRGASGDAVASARVAAISHVIEAYRSEPSVRALWSKVDQHVHFMDPINEQLGEVIGESTLAEIPEVAACGSDTRCQHEVQERHRLLRCAAVTTAFGKWRAGMRELDSLTAQAFRPTYRILTGLIGNVSDPLTYELLRLELQSRVETLIETDVLVPAQQGADLWTVVQATTPCGKTPELEQEVAASLEEPGPCPIRDPYKVTLDFVVAEVSFNCEKVAVEVEGPGLVLVDSFAEVEFAFEGHMTVFAGVKAGLEVGAYQVGPGGKAGCYLTVDRSLQLVDVGAKASVSDGGKVGGYGLEAEQEYPISFISS